MDNKDDPVEVLEIDVDINKQNKMSAFSILLYILV